MEFAHAEGARAALASTGVKLPDQGQLRSCQVAEFDWDGGIQTALKQPDQGNQV